MLEALDRAEDAFGGYTTGAPEYEVRLDPRANQPPVIQLRKACRLLDACRTLGRTTSSVPASTRWWTTSALTGTL